MSQDNEIHQSTEKEHHGEGHGIPKVLKVVYAVFLTWGAFYILKYSIPSLQEWLAK